MKSHPARNARFLAGWAGLSAVVVTGAAVFENAIVTVDYSGTLNTLTQSRSDQLNLTGSPEIVGAPTTNNPDPGSASAQQASTDNNTVSSSAAASPPKTTTTKRAKTKPS